MDLPTWRAPVGVTTGKCLRDRATGLAGVGGARTLCYEIDHAVVNSRTTMANSNMSRSCTIEEIMRITESQRRLPPLRGQELLHELTKEKLFCFGSPVRVRKGSRKRE